MKKMVLTWALLALSTLGIRAQGQCEFPLTIVIPEQAVELSPMSVTQLTSKIRQAVTLNGMTGGTRYSNFCIVANLVETSKHATGGIRPLIAVTTSLELSVSNSRTGDSFGSTFINLSGAGQNAKAAYMASISSLNPQNTALQSFLKATKKKMVSYYEGQTNNIIRQAKSLSTSQDFEQAMYLLTSIPTCINNYDAVESAILSTFQTYLNQDCTSKINKARQAWNASQDREGAKIAGAYLAAVNPAAQCHDEAMELADEIHERIGEEWEWAKDLKEFGKEMARSGVELEKMRIEAARAIGEAYAENQQPQVTIHQHFNSEEE
jgi:hypothetical protein